MNKRDEIIKYMYSNFEDTEHNGCFIQDDKVNDFAEWLVKLFAIPVVSNSLPISDTEFKKVVKNIYPKDNSKRFRRQ